jgi:hypothetical protein
MPPVMCTPPAIITRGAILAVHQSNAPRRKISMPLLGNPVLVGCTNFMLECEVSYLKLLQIMTRGFVGDMPSRQIIKVFIVGGIFSG